MSTNCYSQDSEPSPWNFVWGHSTIPRSFEPDSFQQESIKTGFQWSGSTKMNNALKNDIQTGSYYQPLTEPIHTPLNLILKPTWLDDTGYNPAYFRAVMMQYEPTLPLDGTNEGQILRPDDDTDPIFGFRNRKGTILTNSVSGNYSRLLLYKGGGYTGDTVLSDIWPQPEFYTRDRGGGQTDNYHGEKWYLTINLKRLNPIVDSLKDNSPVLSLRIPYTDWGNQNGIIKFRTLPSSTPNDTTNLDYFEDRGVQQNISDTTTADSLLITNNMLPNNGDNYDNITISAEFITDDGNPLINNYKFSRKLDSNNLNHIRDIDIEVVYHGNTDVAVDYIRIENVTAHHLVRGAADSLGRDTNESYRHSRGFKWYKHTASDLDSVGANTIKDIIQSAIDTIKIKSNDWADAKIFRLNFQDTENDNYYWWGTLRYCNKFANGIFMTRDGMKNPKLYYYYTKSPTKWIGVGFRGDDRLMPAPYCINGKDNYKTMGIKKGYAESGGGVHFPDTLSSDYEVLLDTTEGVYKWDDLKDDSLYFGQIYGSSVLQARYEDQIYHHYFADTKNNFLYSEKPWYFYELLTNFRREIIIDTIASTIDTFYSHNNYRIKTFEELMLTRTTAIIHGSKGFIADGDQNKLFYDTTKARKMTGGGSVGIGDHSKLNDTTDIYSNLVSDDFANEHNTWNTNYPEFDKALISENMKVAEDRIYLGPKSIRDFLYQTNMFLNYNSDELMNLKLAATMSKGYRDHYHWDEDTYGADTLLHKFVNPNDSNETYSTRLFKKSFTDVHLEEPYDSSFFNMTLLRHKDADMDSVFYIGVQNRRTDPLIYWTNPDNVSQKYLRFLSSAEFRDSCINSPDSLLYQDYWWKRLGARKVTIPFNYTYSDTNTYNLLRISEIGSDVDSLNQLWHRGEKYYDMVTDTVIGENRSLSFNLLPGQGKILKVEVLKPDTVAGFLDNYNQTNLISHPTFSGSDDITYHLTYYRNSEKPDDPSKEYQEVQYIRSVPIVKNSQDENIFWNRDAKISLSKLYQESLATPPSSPEYWDCNKPAIVVKNDDYGVPFAYVVYTCKDSNISYASRAKIIYAKVNTMTDSIEFNKEIYKLSFNEIERFGTPTINASANGNYIAWTDSTNGLFVAYDGGGNGVIDDLDSIRDIDYPQLSPNPLLYPSFNTYSHNDEGEDNAGLVWYQKHGTLGGIYYTRVRYDDVASDLILSNYGWNYEWIFGSVGLYPWAHPRILKLKTLNRTDSKEVQPIIYRGLFDYDNDPFSCVYNRVDNINWIDKQFGWDMIDGITLFHQDSMNINKSWKNSYISRGLYINLPYGGNEITSINSAQQDGINIAGNVDAVGGDYNLNFTLNGSDIYQKPGFEGSDILKFSILDDISVDYVFNSPTKAAVGSEVQLAKAPVPNTNNTGNMWKNRRVFETSEKDEFDNPIILASAKLFYKSVYDNKLVNQGFIGFESDSNNVYFDLPKLEDETESISSLPYIIEPDEAYRNDPCLSLVMDNGFGTLDSISVKGIILTDDDSDGDKEMELTMYGNKNNDIKLYLKRDSDGTSMALTTPPITAFPTNGTKLVYSILDSSGSSFTLIYEKLDTLAQFAEKSFIGGLPTNDTISYKSAIKNDPVKYILDFDSGANFEANSSELLDFSVYPNPVSNTVTIQAILPETLNGNRLKNTLLELSITDITGRTILNQTVASGQVVNFDMTNYSNGAYNVKMRYTGSNEFEAVRKIIKK